MHVSQLLSSKQLLPNVPIVVSETKTKEEFTNAIIWNKSLKKTAWYKLNNKGIRLHLMKKENSEIFVSVLTLSAKLCADMYRSG